MTKPPAPIRWGAIGAGDVMERKSGPPLYQRDDSRLVAVHRRDRAKGEDFARRHGCAYAATVAELVTRSDIDAIYVASPEAFHAEHVQAAATAGKHVLCEKEMGRSAAECTQMIEACARQGVSLGVAYYRRCHPSLIEAKRQLAAGAIGRPLRCWMNDQVPIVHRLDLALFLFGDISSITVTTETLPPDSHAATGPVLRCQHQQGALSWGNLKMCENHDIEQIVIEGSEARLVIHDIKAGRMTRTWGWKFERCDQPAHPWAHWGIIGDFVQHLRTGSPLACPGQEGRKTTVIMDLVRAGAGSQPVAASC